MDPEIAGDLNRLENPQSPHEFRTLLDYVFSAVQAGQVVDGMSTLYLGTYGYRRSSSSSDWDKLTRWARAEHPLTALLHQSPFTRRAFEKPRGYAGDAVLIDLIYGVGESPRNISRLGEEIYNWERRSPGCRSVRARRDLLSSTIDFLPTTTRRPRILSLACGHLREALQSSALRDGTACQLVAIDQDAESLEVVRQYGFPAVTVEQRSVKDVLLKRNAYRDFDFAYAAGLYDYLPDNVARALTTAMFRMLRPGGRCLIANSRPICSTSVTWMRSWIGGSFTATSRESRR